MRATNTTERAGKSFSLFSIVQFPNQQWLGVESIARHCQHFLTQSGMLLSWLAGRECRRQLRGRVRGLLRDLHLHLRGHRHHQHHHSCGWTSRQCPGSPPPPRPASARTPSRRPARPGWTRPLSVAQTPTTTVSGLTYFEEGNLLLAHFIC